MRRLLLLLSAVLAALVAVGGAPSASAGGWSAVSLDALPVLEPGEPVDVGFTLLGHGVSPYNDEQAKVVLVAEDGERFAFPVRLEGAEGHHVATIEVPRAGTYTWSVTGQFMESPLGTITAESTSSGGSWTWDALQWGGSGLAVAAAIAALGQGVVTRRARPGVAPA